MSVFSAPGRADNWVPPIAILSVLFGILGAASLRTQDRLRGEGLTGTRPNQVFGAYNEMRATVSEQKKKIADLQSSLTKYQQATATDTGKTKLLYADLQKAQLMAGVVAATGPGVTVTLRDSEHTPRKKSDQRDEDYLQMTLAYHIHDQDIQVVVNELRAAGAEAIAINDQRVVGSTAIRCVGPVVQVNSVPTSGSPVLIKAIGDPVALYGGLSMPGGVKDQYMIADPAMFAIEKNKTLTLPAYAGATPLRFAQAATDKKAEQAQHASETATDNAPSPVTTGDAKRDGGTGAPAMTGGGR